jgi:peptide/nickel transport system permease protein
MSIAPRLFTSYDPYAINTGERLLPPSFKNLLGTDEMGRDLYSRIVYGSSLTISFSVAVVFIALAIGTIIGGVSGYYGKFVDSVIMRSTDIFLAFPMFILAMVIVAALGRSLVNSMLALSLSGGPNMLG